MNIKTSQEVLLIKEKYGISNNDPIFALLDTYGCLQQDIVNSINMVEKTLGIAHDFLEKIEHREIMLENIFLKERIAIAEEGLTVRDILYKDMANKLSELFLSIDQYRIAIEKEREKLRFDRTNAQYRLQNLFHEFILEKKSQTTKNKVSFALIILLVIIQSASIIVLLNAIS